MIKQRMMILICTTSMVMATHGALTNVDAHGATTINTVLPSTAVVVDAIVAIIYASQETVIITQADVDRPTVNGLMRTLDDIIFETIAYLEAKKLGMTPDDQEVESYIATIEKENNMSRAQVEELFVQSGMTMDQGIEQLKKMHAIATLIDHKIRSHLVLSPRDIEQYYEQHPVLAQAQYCLERAIVRRDHALSISEQREAIERSLRSSASGTSIRFGEPFWVDHDDIASDKQFIYAMHKDEVVIHNDSQEFVVWRMHDIKPAHVMSLPERYNEITGILRKNLYEKRMNTYKNELLSAATIVYVNAQ